MTTDPYVILGIPQDAAPPAIRSSYKKLILQCHPDKVHDESLRAEKLVQFQKVQEAYELLIDSRRRRKYDGEVEKAAAAAAAAGSPKSGGSGGQSSEERHRDRGGERDKERGHGRGGRRREEDRRTREEPSPRHAEDPRESPRKSSSYRHQHSEPTSRSYEGHPHYSEEQPSRHKSYSQRYPEESPRKASYGPSSHHRKEPPLSARDIPRESPRSARDIPREPPLSSRDMPRHSPPQSTRDIPRPPEPQPQPAQEAVRPGYLEMKAAEKAKLEGIRRKLTEETSGGVSDEMKQAAIAEKMRERERARLEKEKRERKLREEEEEMRERVERAEFRERPRESSGLGRSTDVPSFRERKSSKSPPTRRGSPTASKVGEDIPSTPMTRPAYVYGSSAPQQPTYPTSHPLNPNNSHGPRRRHSSPSIEKQQHMQRDGHCDSGYSSPSTDTPLTDKKMPSPGAMRAGTEVYQGYDHRAGIWKRYTFEVYVHEDEATAPGNVPTPQGPVPHTTGPLPHVPHQYQSRRAPGSTSPSNHPAEPIGASLPPEFVEKVTGMAPEFVEKVTGTPYFASSTVDSRFGSPPSNHPHSPRSPHSTPPRPHARHHSHHSPNHSPKLGSEAFTPSGVSRSHTYNTHSRRAGLDPRDPHYSGHVPGLARNSTFS
ncbi:DnaJ-domain-containing protein [Tuber magnatum]|uniref:DnaJ-domain-containing protein n=1 Tax=Tuber magnatum TaxID=42249 RepID=A0A317SMT8_9PEZI|nr:DnaJ-domain-containing protein [Tuber magnatum]